jgi:serine/threonine protein kinase
VVLLKRLDHPNIVRVYEAGLHEGSIFCAMELVDCGTLKEVLLARHRLPWREAAEVAVQVCRALAHAHERGCVHRDLKPANLYLSEDGFVKLGDLGLARDLQNSRLTLEGQTVGTWRYMPPEQITAQEQIDGRLDLYALGCILFEMVAGHVPFDGANFAHIFDQHLESVPPRLDVEVGDCPSELADLVDHLLEKEPASRPENAAVVADRLEAMLTGTSHAARLRYAAEVVHDHAGDLVATGPNLTERLRSGAPAREIPRRRRLLALVAVAAAAIVGILLAWRNGH